MSTAEGKISSKSQYHHGDLKAALLVSAEIELEEKGIEAFSLRGVAKRTGVSHAAPAHHFKDVNALLTALGVVGFKRFLNLQLQRQQQAKKDDLSQIVASGQGYIDFAMSHPAMFRLIFSSHRLDDNDPEFHHARKASFGHLINDVKHLTHAEPLTDDVATQKLVLAWSMVHGMADLMNNGRLKMLLKLPAANREALIVDIIRMAMS